MPGSSGISRRQAISGMAKTMGAMTAAGLASGIASANPGTHDEQLAWTPAWQLQGLLRNGEISPVELTRCALDRIARFDPIIHAYITVDSDGAQQQAAQAERAIMNGDELGPLHGIPISIKDLYATRGLRTTQGSQVFADTVPEADEILVERLRNAGAIIIGKTQTPEFATFPRTKTLLAGECLNPWNTGRISGASSGGAAAAVCMGMSSCAIGSDGGGSTRIPAALNGVFGFQPSAGRVPSRTPVSVHMASAGPITLDVRDGAIMMQVISGRDARDPSAIDAPAPDLVNTLDLGIAGLRIGWSPDWGVIPHVDDRALDLARQATWLFANAGAAVEQAAISLPDVEAWQVFIGMNEYSYRRTGRLLAFDAGQRALLTPPVMGMLRQIEAMGGTLFSPEDYTRLFEVRRGLVQWIEGVFADFDVICTPTVGQVAPMIPDGEWDQPYADQYSIDHISTNYTYIANVLGLPAASVPCGFIDDMPVGLQIIGPRLADERVFRAAQTFSGLMPWANRHPPLAALS